MMKAHQPTLVALVGVLLFGFVAAMGAQDSVHFVPADRVAVRVMREVPPIDVAPGVHVRTVVGSTGSFSLGDFDAGGTAPLHHHAREQADVILAGVFDITLGNHLEEVGPGAGFIVPPNVRHSIANVKGGVMTVIEGHTVPRPDLVPPRPSMTFPASSEPMAIPGERKLAVQLETAGGAPSDPVATVVGETCALAWRRLERGASPVTVGPSGRRGELFVYIVRGDVGLAAPGPEQVLRAGTLVVIPAAAAVTMRATGTTGAATVEFSPQGGRASVR